MKKYYLEYNNKGGKGRNIRYGGINILSLRRRNLFIFVKTIISREIRLNVEDFFRLNRYLEFNNDDEAELWFRLNY